MYKEKVPDVLLLLIFTIHVHFHDDSLFCYHCHTQFIFKHWAFHTEENPDSLTPPCGCLSPQFLVFSRSKINK